MLQLRLCVRDADIEAAAGRTLPVKEKPSGRRRSSNAGPKEGGVEKHDAGGPEQQSGKSSRRKGRSSDGHSRVMEPPLGDAPGGLPVPSEGGLLLPFLSLTQALHV